MHNNQSNSNNTTNNTGTGNITRVSKSIIINASNIGPVNNKIIKQRYYNSFNYSMMFRERRPTSLTIGITSPKPGEGKTVVASNLAVSLALGSQRNTVFVDLNPRNPQAHEIFGIDRKPGLAEAFKNGSIELFQTSISQLYVLTSGGWKGRRISVGHLTAFRDVLHSLQREFDFIVIDMGAVLNEDFPMLFTNEIDGMMVVVDSTRTKQADLDNMFRVVNKNQVIGFILNRAEKAS